MNHTRGAFDVPSAVESPMLCFFASHCKGPQDLRARIQSLRDLVGEQRPESPHGNPCNGCSREIVR